MESMGRYAKSIRVASEYTVTPNSWKTRVSCDFRKRCAYKFFHHQQYSSLAMGEQNRETIDLALQQEIAYRCSSTDHRNGDMLTRKTLTLR